MYVTPIKWFLYIFYLFINSIGYFYPYFSFNCVFNQPLYVSFPDTCPSILACVDIGISFLTFPPNSFHDFITGTKVVRQFQCQGGGPGNDSLTGESSVGSPV